ncbi:MAG: MBL fold metallo-hydrolase [Desulfohalobiaceae bacterium]
MRIVFLGVGEAVDLELSNTCLLLEDQGRLLVMDCGFSAAPRILANCRQANALDAVWVSHLHGDHCFGLPQLLLGLRQLGRDRPLNIVCGRGGRQRVLQLLAQAYPNLLRGLGFELIFRQVQPGQSLELLDMDWAFAQTEHPEPNLALGLHSGGKSIYFSGDGKSGAAGLELARGCDLLVHEAYLLQPGVPGHSSVQECLELGRQCGAKQLALVHIQMQERRSRRADILQAVQSVSGLQAWMPEPDQELWI